MQRETRFDWWTRPWAGSAIALAAYAGLTAGLSFILDSDRILDVALLYLLLTLVVAAQWGYWVGAMGAVVADLLVNFFFVLPVHTFNVQKPANVIALLIFLTVSLVGATMLSRLRRQATIATAREAETALLLRLSQEVASAASPRDAMDRLCAAVTRSFRARGCWMVREGNPWVVHGSTGPLAGLTRDEEAVARAAIQQGSIARVRGRDEIVFVPFGKTSPERGVLRIEGPIRPPPMARPELLLRAFADDASIALHRAMLAEEARTVDTLKRADEFKSVLISSVSHDLRTPLTAIKAAVGSLRDTSVDWSKRDSEEFLETIEGETDRLTRTVNSLLEMSRLEGGAVRPTLELLEVEPLFAELQSAVVQLAPGRTITASSGPGLWIRADYALLTQALRNIIENAARYSLTGGAIHLSAEQAGARVNISIRDEGPGIAAQDLPHIFEKFYRGRGSKGAKGTGLGLAIVKAMVELSGGTVDVASSRDGTTFQVAFPRVPAPRR